MAMRSSRISEVLWQTKGSDGLEQMSKAIYDTLNEILSTQFKSLVEVEAARVEERIRSLAGEITERLKGLEQSWEEKGIELSQYLDQKIRGERNYQDRELDRVTTLVKSIQPVQGISAEAGLDIVTNVSKALEDRFEKRLAGFEEWVRENLAGMKAAHTEGLESLKSILQSLPPPVANVYNEREAININVPEQPAPHITVKASEVTVRVPEQPPAQIMVQSAKPMRKTISYDLDGRPTEIVEREVSE